MGFKDKKAAVAKKAEVTKKAKKTAKVSEDPMVHIGKLGESTLSLPAEANDTVFSVLKRTTFPEGAIVNKAGKSVTNLIDAAEADIKRGVRKNMAECIKDIRVNGSPANLETKVVGGDILTMIPDIEGG